MATCRRHIVSKPPRSPSPLRPRIRHESATHRPPRPLSISGPMLRLLPPPPVIQSFCVLFVSQPVVRRPSRPLSGASHRPLIQYVKSRPMPRRVPAPRLSSPTASRRAWRILVSIVLVLFVCPPTATPASLQARVEVLKKLKSDLKLASKLRVETAEVQLEVEVRR